MNKEEMLRKLKGIQLLYSMPMRAQNMRSEHFAIVEYEKLAYEQQAIIDQLTNNWNELEEWLKEDNPNVYCCSKSSQKAFEGAKAMYKIIILNKMKEIKEKNNE